MGNESTSAADYAEKYKPSGNVRVIKKDGTLEIFNVQKVLNAVGKSAYRL